MKTETNSNPSSSLPDASTTFNTWGRVAEEQMQRMGELFEQSTKMQTAALDQGRELLAYNMKLAGEWQTWASEASRNVATKIFSKK